LRIVSENNFPTAAGLASSAAGFAALVRAIANLYELPETPTELSRIARQGSVSACRSLFGGYVAWQMGEKDDGSDSLAVEIAPASHWPNMKAVILVASAKEKGTSSTSGMQQTVATSAQFQARVAVEVPRHMELMTKAIKEKDFETFAKVTMIESNSFHATCLNTYPPIRYLNGTSFAAQEAVEAINRKAGKDVAAYTFDAGPNAVIYYEAENEALVAGPLRAVLGEVDGWKEDIKAVEGSDSIFSELAVKTLKSGVSRVICTGVGEGPIKTKESLVGEDGGPKK